MQHGKPIRHQSYKAHQPKQYMLLITNIFGFQTACVDCLSLSPRRQTNGIGDSNDPQPNWLAGGGGDLKDTM